MASLDLGSLTYSVITANQIRLVDRVNQERLNLGLSARYFLGAGVVATAWVVVASDVNIAIFWVGVASSVVFLALSSWFYRSAKQYPSGGVVDILEANGLPLEEVTVQVKVTPVNNAGEPVSFPEPSMVPQ